MKCKLWKVFNVIYAFIGILKHIYISNQDIVYDKNQSSNDRT